MHTSYSALNTFLTCPLKYKYQAIDKIRTPQSPEQAFGSLIHRTLRYAHSATEKGYPKKEAVINYFSQNWNQESFPKEVSERGFFEDGLQILGKYLDSMSDEDKKKSIATEHRFIVKVGDHTLGGAIDRIDRTEFGFEIIDYKTSRKIPPQKEIDNDLQLSIYLRAFITQWPSLFERLKDTAKITLSLEYLRHNLRLSTTRTQDDLKKIDSDILAIIDQVQKAEKLKEFEPHLNPLCDWCDFQKICPLWSHKFKTSDVRLQTSEKEIQEIGKRFILLKGKKREIEKEIAELGVKLSGYLEQEKLGQFFTDEGNILRALRQTYKYDSKAVADILNKIGKDPFSVLKIDSAALNKIAAGLPAEQRRELTRLRKVDRQSYVLIVKNK
ncbi:MAG: PD-(D/E)XK nuclease family protein [Candidatus Moraniibacteriota bacterium]